MNKNDISIATITLARDQHEEMLLRQSLQKLAEFEIPVFITDGGSTPGFVDFLHSFRHFHLSDKKVTGVWPQAKQSLLQAYTAGSPFIFYTEPDKFNFFDQFLSDMLHHISVNEKSGIVLASRSSAGFATFPAFQKMTETTINNCCTEITGKAVDFTYGPFLLNRKLVPYLKQVHEDVGWGWRPYLFGIACRLGYSVEACINDFYCPIGQREDTAKERVYRMRQLQQNIQGIVLSAGVELNEK